MCVDALSWCPQSLATLGQTVGIPKLDLPARDDSDEAWFRRCERDVEILAEVWRRLMWWVRSDDLGNWKPTGAGQAWAAFRHRFISHPLLVHEDDDARDAERLAAHTGRCEAWRHGDLGAGPWYEWDAICAYANIGATHDVPTKLRGELHRPTLADVHRVACSSAVLVECDVVTECPTLAVRTDDGIVWPVGQFSTVAWENELSVALANGATVTVRRAWAYRRAPALQAFCKWVLWLTHPDNRDVDPVVAVAAKHWSRALIGRTAATWPKWETWGSSPVFDVALGRFADASTGERGRFLQVGNQLLRSTAERENPDALVAIMSWVMAQARVDLWGAMTIAGLDRVAYVDTDSLIVDPVGHRRLVSAAVPGLRVKSVWHGLRVLGPRQIVTQGLLRAAGIPKGARTAGDDEWEGDVWDGLGTSLASGVVDEVHVTRRTFRLAGVDRRRQHVDGGLTEAVRLW